MKFAHLVFGFIVLPQTLLVSAELTETDRQDIKTFVAGNYSSDVMSITIPKKIGPIKWRSDINEGAYRVLKEMVDRRNREIHVWVRRKGTEKKPYLLKLIKKDCVWVSTGFERLRR